MQSCFAIHWQMASNCRYIPQEQNLPFYASKYGCRFMQSTYEISIEIPFGQLGQKFMQEKIIDHFWPIGPEVILKRVIMEELNAESQVSEIIDILENDHPTF